MKIIEEVYLVGGGMIGLSHPSDSYVYLIDGKSEIALIDAGVGIDSEQIFHNIENEGYQLSDIKKVILTHTHADHAGGCRDFKEKAKSLLFVPQAEVGLFEGGSDDELGLNIAKESGIYLPDYVFPHCKVDYPVKHNETIKVGNLSLRSVNVPGHSPGSTCFLMEKEKRRILFTGDVVFYDGEIGLLNYSGSNLADYRKYITRLANLSVDVLLPGHKMFTLRGGQEHIDKAIEALRELSVPKSFI